METPCRIRSDERTKKNKQDNVFQAQGEVAKIGIFYGSSTEEDLWLDYPTDKRAKKQTWNEEELKCEKKCRGKQTKGR